MSSAKPVSYQVRRFVPNHRKAMVFELIRRTPKSTTGTVTDSRVVHQGEPLSAFRQAQNDLLDAAPRPTLAEAQFNAAMAQAVAVAEQTPATVRETCPECLRPTEPITTPAPKVELREFTFRYWTKSDGQGHQDILAENREQALAVLWMLDGDYISKVWAD